ncbi:MAG: glycerol kinase GlpK [Nitriliruptorales bacterium]|nr:glycerol kinase GlpK [Nitriliruptorales bacterium]
MRILSIDAGTTGVRGVVVDERGEFLGAAYREFTQHFPRPGWVEHDAEEIWDATVEACGEVLRATGTEPGEVTAIGITNQRETTVVWERATLAPVHHAIVWQDRRTAGRCDELETAGHGSAIRRATGLVIDAYFSGTKLAWILDEVDDARDRAERGELAFGTVDSWLVAKLTGGASHVTEPSNASRTMLWDIREDRWSEEMLGLLDVPASVLPEVRDSAGEFGRTDPEAFLGIDAPITGIGGDQQSALFGQGCWTPGTSKNTYGTGSFMLLNTGAVAPSSEGGLLTSVAWRLDGEVTYCLEGAIFVTGAAVQWLRDGLGVIDDAAETETLAAALPDGNEGVYLVPAFVGLGAPHWDSYARGTLVGLTRGTDRGHLARAAIEAMAYQSADVADLMRGDSGQEIAELRVDGGAAKNDLLCQFQADLLGAPVLRPEQQETTVQGAAFLAGLGAGVWSSTDELADVWRLDRRFEPQMDGAAREQLRSGWSEAVERSLGWAKVVGTDDA